MKHGARWGEVVSQILQGFGGEALDLSFSCSLDPQKVKTVEFSQREFFMSVDGIDINAEHSHYIRKNHSLRSQFLAGRGAGLTQKWLSHV